MAHSIAQPSSEDQGNSIRITEDWQCNQSILKRNQYMFEHQLATDVTFIVGNSDDDGQVEKIQAHKYILISGSPVFWSMFQGDIREDGDIKVPDVEPQVFREMLKFLYYEEADITGDSVMQILYTSKKYILPALATMCRTFLEENLTVENVCVILEQCLLFNDKELQETCMNIIRIETENVFKSDGFKAISRETLMTILESSEMNVEEVEILQAGLDWAKHQLQTKNEDDSDGQSLRKELGDAIYKIRFTEMSFEQFGDVAVTAEILTQSEENLCFRFFSQSVKPEKVPFETEPRRKPQMIFALKCENELSWTTAFPQDIRFKLKNKSDKTIKLRGLELSVDTNAATAVYNRSNHLRGWSVVNYKPSDCSITELLLVNPINITPSETIEMKILFSISFCGTIVGIYDPTNYSNEHLKVLLTPLNDDLIPVRGVLYEDTK